MKWIQEFQYTQCIHKDGTPSGITMPADMDGCISKCSLYSSNVAWHFQSKDLYECNCSDDKGDKFYEYWDCHFQITTHRNHQRTKWIMQWYTTDHQK
jgi:hypothetical protein